MEEHSFFNSEIKPALVVINLFLGLLVPATLFFGLIALVLKPMQAYMSGGQQIAQSIVWAIGGIGFPLLTIWSIFRTWAAYRQEQYRKAFYISISPIVFAAALLGIFGLLYLIETFIMLFE